MKTKLTRLIGALAMLALVTLNLQLTTVYAQGTAFTYQGQLNSGGSPATGSYDLAFTLFTTPIASWSASTSPTLTGGTNYLNVTNPSGNLFYRLTHP